MQKQLATPVIVQILYCFQILMITIRIETIQTDGSASAVTIACNKEIAHVDDGLEFKLFYHLVLFIYYSKHASTRIAKPIIVAIEKIGGEDFAELFQAAAPPQRPGNEADIGFIRVVRVNKPACDSIVQRLEDFNLL